MPKKARIFIYILPAVLLLSYYPLIHFGSSSSMNFEISLPIIWLVLFDLYSIFYLIKTKSLGKITKHWPWLFFPIFATMSVFWSPNFLRGVLTSGILWLIYLAGFSFYNFKDILKPEKTKKSIIKAIFYSTLVVCIWCFIQCALDLAGISKDYTLMCAGCGYQMFGFPHPNGFAIEPQFMGNLLLAPTIIAGWLFIKKSPKNAVLIALFFIFTATLFLTFSRGAIYAFVIGMIFLSIANFLKTKSYRTFLVWPIIILAFLFTLNLQAVMAKISNTSDTYKDGVTKVIDHLSLGILDFREPDVDAFQGLPEVATEDEVASPVKTGASDPSRESIDESPKEEAVFDGYAEESTNIRLGVASASLEVWRSTPENIIFGVGLGGTGDALYKTGLSPSPKEIAQNQYISILLETGIIGMSLLILSLILVIKATLKSSLKLPLFALEVSYALTLLFFSGLPNALHIYLLPSLLLATFSSISK